MKVFQTNATLGYNQLFYIAKIGESDNYLIIGTKNVSSYNDYQIGDTIEDLPDISIEETNYKIEQSPLFGTYLFNYWMNQVEQEIKK